MGRGAASGLAYLDSSIARSTEMANLTGIVEEDICDLFREVYAALKPGIAKLEILPSRDPAGGADIILRPTNPKSAQIWSHASDRTVSLRFGRHSITEVFATYKAETKALNKIRWMSEAVINGELSEDVWLLDGKVVKAVGSLKVDSKVLKLRYCRFCNPFRSRERQHFSYLPYSASE